MPIPVTIGSVGVSQTRTIESLTKNRNFWALNTLIDRCVDILLLKWIKDEFLLGKNDLLQRFGG